MSNEENAGTAQARLSELNIQRGDRTRVGHCKKDATDVYIGRGRNDRHMTTTPSDEIGRRGWLGNPFPVDEHGRRQCVDRFRTEFEARLKHDEEFRAAVRDLAGKTLGCWCQRLNDDGPLCHGEVIAEWADRLADGEVPDGG